MAEQLPISPEHHAHPEAKPSPERLRPAETSEHHQPEHAPDIEHLKEKVEAAAKSSRETPVEAHHHKEPSHHPVNSELKSEALRRTLTRVRKHLATPDKVLSKVIHQPVVNAISNAGAKTIARPSGILSGGFFALVGSSFMLYMAKHYGFHYNLLIFIIVFAGGYVLGVAFEFLMRLAHRKHS